MRITVTLADEVGKKLKQIPQNRRAMFVERAIVLAFEQTENDEILRFIARKPLKVPEGEKQGKRPSGKSGKKPKGRGPQGLSDALGEFGEG